MTVVTAGPLRIGEGLPKICVSVTAETAELAARQTSRILAEGADLIEFRADLYDPSGDPESIMAGLEAVRENAGDVPVLFTFRTAAQGGKGTGDAERYASVCRVAAGSGCISLLDVELVNENRVQVMLNASEYGIPVIASDHFYDGTPMEDKMTALFLQMERAGAAIAKLAVMPESSEDTEALIRAAKNARKKMHIPLIAIAMGEEGVRTRTECETFGGCITYGRCGTGSAPGQLPVNILRERLLAEHEKLEMTGHLL